MEKSTTKVAETQSGQGFPGGGGAPFVSNDAGFGDFTRLKVCYNRILEKFRSLAFTMADRRSSRFHILSCALAFTMAEILISLTIIGIIAAITLPALQANINESAWKAQRKALYSRMSQAISMMPSLNGYGIVFNENGEVNETETASKATQTFISNGLSKVLKINNICDGSTAEGLKKCGFPNKFTKMGINSKINTPETLQNLNWYFNSSYATPIVTNNAVFETNNGESILVSYNPNCGFVLGKSASSSGLLQSTMCANFIYDLNGNKGPNKVGKDIGFMTAFYPTDSEVVMPIPAGQLTVRQNKYPIFSIATGNQACRDSYGANTKMANLEEIKSVFVNNKLGYINSSYPNFFANDSYFSSTIYNTSKIYILNSYSGSVYNYGTFSYSVDYKPIFCLKK